MDKLESVPGFNAEIGKERFIELVNRQHVAVIGQTGAVAPADKKLYALRDVTGIASVQFGALGEQVPQGGERRFANCRV